MNADLERERRRATFSVEKLTHMLDGGADRTARRRFLEAVITRDPTGIFGNDDNPYLHRNDRHVRSLAKFVRLVELCRLLKIDGENGDFTKSNDFYLLIHAIADDLPAALHWIMFIPNIRSLCDDEQQAQWLPLCRDFKMVGCYAQTELGHGSNIRALETTATFLPESKGGGKGGSFVIHSPTLTSYKFWPGTMGRTANHAMVIANLIDGQGINRGIHNFLVPLRSMVDHSLLPGVTTLDIGPKIGYNNMDNGCAMFHHVIIPRRNMAMRFAQVDEKGNYSKTRVSQASSKVAYITMMQVRAHICHDSSRQLAMACTIAIRYSAIRRQGFADENDEEGGTELQILDYKQQQYRLFTRLAASYAFFFTGRKLLNVLSEMESRLVRSTQSNNVPTVTKAQVTDVHAASSALKSYVTTFAADGMEDCRKACGGHGFLVSSGLPELVTTYLQNPTVEGDNHLLPQHVVKVLLKLVQAVQAGDNLSDYEPCESYHLVPSLHSILHRNRDKALEKYKCASPDSVMDLDAALGAFRHRAARLLVMCASDLYESSSAPAAAAAWNRSLVQMDRISRAYAQFLLLRDFSQGIQEEEQKGIIGTPEVEVLRDLARLLALYWMEGDIGSFLEDGHVSPQQARWISQGVLDILDRIRPNAVALVDARDFSDFRLKSALGRYDGNVYPAIVEAARRDPLNQKDIGPGYQEHLKRLYVDGVGVYTGTASRL